jgi:WD40 repeat protein
MAFSPDDSLLAVGGNALTLWRLDQYSLAQQLPTAGLIGRPYFIQSGKLLALAGWDERLRLWGIPDSSR